MYLKSFFAGSYSKWSAQKAHRDVMRRSTYAILENEATAVVAELTVQHGARAVVGDVLFRRALGVLEGILRKLRCEAVVGAESFLSWRSVLYGGMISIVKAPC